MTRSEIISEFKRMKPSEQKILYRTLQKIMEESPRKRAVKKGKFQPGKFTPAKNSSLFQVLGALREEGKPAPTDQEVEQMIADYLTEKHA